MLAVLGEQILQVLVGQGRHEVIDHVEPFLTDVLQLHLLGPIELAFDLGEAHLHPWIALGVVVEAGFELFELEGGCVEELVEVVAEFPNVENPLEVLGAHIDFHRSGLGSHDTAMQFWHFLDEGVRDGVSDRVALDVFGVQLAENLELLLDELGAFDFFPFGRRQDVLGFGSLALLCLEGRLSE